MFRAASTDSIAGSSRPASNAGVDGKASRLRLWATELFGPALAWDVCEVDGVDEAFLEQRDLGLDCPELVKAIGGCGGSKGHVVTVAKLNEPALPLLKLTEEGRQARDDELRLANAQLYGIRPHSPSPPCATCWQI
ncbi:hypothetical protein [Actinomyces bovis]|uniref:hypothetical protein n=1 Tax=Actinomyces bovis TaxID=1658 RepID=UPI001559295C|nr:hypothetical protein [Actinomyces bovis]